LGRLRIGASILSFANVPALGSSKEKCYLFNKLVKGAAILFINVM